MSPSALKLNGFQGNSRGMVRNSLIVVGVHEVLDLIRKFLRKELRFSAIRIVPPVSQTVSDSIFL